MTLDRAALLQRLSTTTWREAAPVVGAAVAFGILFWRPATTLANDWWSNPDAAHGLLLGPLAAVLAWRRGWVADATPQPRLGIAIMAGAVVLRYLSGLAAELFTMRMSLLAAIAGILVFTHGVRQVRHWWLPTVLLVLSVPLPAVLLNSLAFPLQFKASQMGAALLEWRHVPVRLEGNVLRLPGRSLFVTEACSGLRSLTALLSLGILIGGLWLRSIPARAFIVLAAIPVAMVLNGVRIFLTGFLSYFVSPALAEGVMHYSEGWAMFVVAFALLGAISWGVARLERRVLMPRAA